MTGHSKPKSGFTIVELLIVIVVVAILAAISIVAYNGIQERAYNTKIVAMVRSYAQSIELYRTEQGHYPSTSLEDNDEQVALVCLGEGYDDQFCGVASAWSFPTHEDETFNAKLDRYMPGRPQVNSQMLAAAHEEFIGAIYGIDIITTQEGVHDVRARTIQYALHGSHGNCVLAGAWAYRVTETPRHATACIIELEHLL